jgi:hypothetical protein
MDVEEDSLSSQTSPKPPRSRRPELILQGWTFWKKKWLGPNCHRSIQSDRAGVKVLELSSQKRASMRLTVFFWLWGISVA